MNERRKSVRQRVLKGGKIVFHHRCAAIDCTVRNISEGGASIAVASTVGVPQDFELLLDGTDHARHCRIVWRSDTRIGVEFRSLSNAA